jgi:hypothetical protein
MTEIEKINEAIAACEYVIGFEKPAIMMPTKHIETALTALREKAEREDPEPLLLEQLLTMDSTPVWVEYLLTPTDEVNWCVIEDQAAHIPGCDYARFEFKDYGRTWIAYAHRPGGN